MMVMRKYKEINPFVADFYIRHIKEFGFLATYCDRHAIPFDREDGEMCDVSELYNMVNSQGVFCDLRNLVRKFNPFQVLKISTMEIRHSSVLAWLLNPHETHALGDRFLRNFLKSVRRLGEGAMTDISKMVDSEGELKVDVTRENKHMDLLIVDRAHRVTVVVENKILATERTGTGDSPGQLDEYYKQVRSLYGQDGYGIVCVYLTRNGDLPSKENWGVVSYGEIIECLRAIVKEGIPAGRAGDFINQYLSVLELNVNGCSDEVEHACRAVFNSKYGGMILSALSQCSTPARFLTQIAGRRLLAYEGGKNFAYLLPNQYGVKFLKGIRPEHCILEINFSSAHFEPPSEIYGKVFFKYQDASDDERQKMDELWGRIGDGADAAKKRNKRVKCPTVFTTERQMIDVSAELSLDRFKRIVDRVIYEVMKKLAKLESSLNMKGESR